MMTLQACKCLGSHVSLLTAAKGFAKGKAVSKKF